VVVVDNLKTNLLGLPAIIALQLAVKTDIVQIYKPTAQTNDVADSTTWMKRFPKMFQGLGTLAKDYEIHLCPDAKPHAIFTPRRILLPLCPKVGDELNYMEKAGVISKVSEPTARYTGMVIVPKKIEKYKFMLILNHQPGSSA